MVYDEIDKTYQIYQLKVGSSKILNYTYILVDKISGQAAIVDPAWDLEGITNIFRELGSEPGIILLTHSHNDHVNLVDQLIDQFNSQVYMSAKEIDFYDFRCKNLHSIHNNDIINLGKTPITCLVTPGHTAGGICYLLADSLFTGDTIFIEGCGICTTVGGSPEQMFESIQSIKKVVEPHVRIYPGHSFGKKPGYSIDYLQKYNIYFQIESKEHFIKFRMRKNQKNLFNFK